MTEILIIANNSIVMGATSATTGRRNGTLDGASKLFGLSNDPPMGIMIFGADSFGSINLEALIKDYRTNTDFGELGDILKIKDSFIEYLNNVPFDSTDFENKLIIFKEDLLKRFLNESKDGLVKFLNDYKDMEILPFLENNSLIDAEFEDMRKQLDDIDVEIDTFKKYLSKVLLDSSSGIVIAGYNKKSFSPSYISFNLITQYDDEIIISNFDSCIDCERNLIIPVSQNEVIGALISGVSDDFIHFLKYIFEKYVEAHSQGLINFLGEKCAFETDFMDEALEFVKKCNKQSVEMFMDEIEIFRKENIENFTRIVEKASTEELVHIAKILINFASIRKAFDLNLRTVAGADVMAITKGDGLVFKCIDSI